jgi:5'-nucleotidase
MKHILTNDDGVDAPGLEALALAVHGWGSPTVIAPDGPRSGIGHRVTMDGALRLVEHEPDRYSLSGTPADCIRVGLVEVANGAAWVLAGINRGANLGVDVYSSGTVAAAREAAFLGCAAVAISQYVGPRREVDWQLTAMRARRVLEKLAVRPSEPGTFLNVNLPHPEDDREDLEIVFCAVDTSPHDVRYRREGSALHYDGDYHQRPRQAGRDVDTCFGGRVAVTVIAID